MELASATAATALNPIAEVAEELGLSTDELEPHGRYAAIAAIARPEQTIVLEPDFEAVAGLRGHSHKPEQAWRSFAGIEQAAVPPPLTTAVERVLALARD